MVKYLKLWLLSIVKMSIGDKVEKTCNSLISWLGRKCVNGTLLGEDELDEIDIQQLKDIMNSDSEESQC